MLVDAGLGVSFDLPEPTVTFEDSVQLESMLATPLGALTYQSQPSPSLPPQLGSYLSDFDTTGQWTWTR